MLRLAQPRGLSLFPRRRLVAWSSSGSGLASTAPDDDAPALSRLNPAPDDYASSSFADKTQLTLQAGRGGAGCVSFLREAFYPDGPPNGGDGGHGGSIYIQAAPGESSLLKLSRRPVIRASRGKNGQGGSRSGSRGDDVVITVPVGTIVRELQRYDPVAEDAAELRAWRAAQKERRRAAAAHKADDAGHEPRSAPAAQQDADDDDPPDPQRRCWLPRPGLSSSERKALVPPPLPRRRRLLQQPEAPIYLDLSVPTPHPILLAAGGLGGLGNSHFISREHPRPLFATKGHEPVQLRIELELKLLADVGLVGLPNAGKSTLLRSLTNSRTRVGSWAFTTLRPNIGTVILDRHSGRPLVSAPRRSGPGQSSSARSRFTIADIPGLVHDAHLDRGLGIAFLRHVERAALLALVVDLGAGDAVDAVNALWRELSLYDQMRRQRDKEDRPDGGHDNDNQVLPLQQQKQHIATKPWFVVATKADLPGTEANFGRLQAYLEAIRRGAAPHPSGLEGAWTGDCAAIPVSAIRAQGVDRIIERVVGLLA